MKKPSDFLRQNKALLLYVAKFLGLFCLLFYGTEAVIGLSAPGHQYNGFVAHYLNFIDPFRRFLLVSSKALLSLVGVQTNIKDAVTVSVAGGRGVRIVYSCLGYGVLSFWVAFIFANKGSWKKKAAWVIGGGALLCAVNIVRISLLLLATNRGWPVPFGWDHHTWFNVVAYAIIFGMIHGYDRAGKKRRIKEAKSPSEPMVYSVQKQI